MKTSEFNYQLPPELIAQYPLEKRDASRLLVMRRDTGAIEHKRFPQIFEYLVPGDVLVLNNTRVIPARVVAEKSTGAKTELLLFKKKSERVWEALVKPGKRVKPGNTLSLGDGIQATVLAKSDDGKFTVEFSQAPELWLEQKGAMPLPPYIRRKPVARDRETYQTVFAEVPGAVAAPTAGLHFTGELLRQATAYGVTVCYVTLHVGLGTFLPVRTEEIADHRVESEWASIGEQSAAIINSAKRNRKRIIAVGTTTARTLEGFSGENGVESGTREIDLFIFPPYEFAAVDALITNFHLPQSSLLALVCAFGTHENVMHAYEIAVRETYRFYSYGDAMFIL